MTAEEVLRTRKTYCLVGASQDKDKYGYKLLRTLLDAGHAVFPVNPRYDHIDEQKCYASLDELPEPPEVVIIALAPANTESMLDHVAARDFRLVWIPPGCGSGSALKKCRQLGLDVLYDVCPVGTLARMRGE